MNLALLLDMAAETWPARTAIGDDRRSLAFTRLRLLANALANRIRDTQARTLCFLDVNGPAAAVALFAAARAGVPYAPLNYRLTAAECEALLARLEAPLIVAAPRQLTGLTLPTGSGVVDSSELLASGHDAAAAPAGTDADPDGVAVLLFTSGTTGAPKAALLRHAHLTAYVLATVEFGSADPGEATLVAVPPYHVAGIAAMLTSCYAGRRIVVLPEFDPDAWLACVAAERITQGFLVPTMLARILERLEAAAAPPPPALRSIAYGGGPMPMSVIERALRLFPHVDFTNAYGLTEASSTICLLGPQEHRAAWSSSEPAARARLGSVGRPLPSVEVQVRDEQDRVLAPGEAGLVFVRGAQVAGEYRETGCTLDAGGWFPTRDRGWLDEAGYLFLDGRADDVIVRGGENISPGEIEAVLREHPAVAEAAVVAVPSEEWGEAVGAVVVPRGYPTASEEELQSWVRTRLRSSRVPQRVLFSDRLPYNEMGKLLRRELRRQFGG